MPSSEDFIRETLLALNLTNDMDREEGFTRLSFSNEERLAHKKFRKIAESLGMKTSEDKVGNQWAILEVDEHAKTIAFGSHLDTVTSGGGYDGVAGIVCALSMVYELRKRNVAPAHNIVIIVFVSEESARFGLSTIGSKTIVGDVQKEKWENIQDESGITIREAMENYGINWHTFHQAYDVKHEIDEFIELHIEQGSQLEERKKEIGIVYGIATPIRLQVTVIGQANHTGTTLMDSRKDALVAASPIIDYVHTLAKQFNEQISETLSATVSKVNVKPNAINIIPGIVELGIDIRSVDDELKEKFAKQISQFTEALAEEKGVSIKVEELINEPAIILNKDIRNRLKTCCEQLGLSFITMNSGAGHDAMNMAKRWPTGMVFIPSVDGISHHPKEYTPLKYLQLGVTVLTTYVRNTGNGVFG